MKQTKDTEAMRYRHKYMIFGSLLVMLIWILSDPDLGLIDNLTFGAGLIATIVILSKTVLYAGALHMTRKALFDYIDLEDIINRAKQTPEGAGRVTQAIGLFAIAISIIILAAVSK